MSEAFKFEIEAADIIRLMLQFCEERGLPQTRQVLAAETGISLAGIVPTSTSSSGSSGSSFYEPLREAIRAGKWDEVLSILRTGDPAGQIDSTTGLELAPELALLPAQLHARLLEHILFELVDGGELETAQFICDLPPLSRWMQQQHSKRFDALKRLASGKMPFSRAKVFAAHGGDQQSARDSLADAISSAAIEVAPGRLLALASDAIRYRSLRGQISPAASSYDVFTGREKLKVAAEASSQNATTMRLPRKTGQGVLANALAYSVEFENSRPECAVFSPDGFYLITGSVEGFIEVWSASTGKLSADLDFQSRNEMMAHQTAVLCLAFSADGSVLASGARDGTIKVWEFRTGRCIRKLGSPQTGNSDSHISVTSLAFVANDATEVLAGYADGTCTLWGLQNGNTLRRLQGHNSSVVFVGLHPVDPERALTASLDGTLGVWDLATGERVHEWFPGAEYSENSGLRTSQPFPINNVCVLPGQNRLAVVCGHSSFVYVVDLLNGAEEARFVSDRPGKTMFVAASVDAASQVSALLEDGTIYSYVLGEREPTHVLASGVPDSVGLVQHPHHSLLGVWGLSKSLRMFV